MEEHCTQDRIYRTSQIAKLTGTHPNTVRLYEQLMFIPPVPRESNGYRAYTERHLWHMRLARTALRCDYVEGDIRRRATEFVKTAARGELVKACNMAYGYLCHIREERAKAEEALALAQEWISGNREEKRSYFFRRSDVAKLLEVTVDVLRDWERNGLIDIPRAANNYRVYGPMEIGRLKIIRTLRKANYSMMSVLRMLNCVENGYNADLRTVLDTPPPEEDIISAADRWISTLVQTESDALEVIDLIKQMTDIFKDPSVSIQTDNLK